MYPRDFLLFDTTTHDKLIGNSGLYQIGIQIGLKFRQCILQQIQTCIRCSISADLQETHSWTFFTNFFERNLCQFGSIFSLIIVCYCCAMPERFFPNKKKDSEYESWVWQQTWRLVPKPSSGEEWTCKEVLLCEESKQLQQEMFGDCHCHHQLQHWITLTNTPKYISYYKHFQQKFVTQPLRRPTFTIIKMS